jgi:hypothetical protein
VHLTGTLQKPLQELGAAGMVGDVGGVIGLKHLEVGIHRFLHKTDTLDEKELCLVTVLPLGKLAETLQTSFG